MARDCVGKRLLAIPVKRIKRFEVLFLGADRLVLYLLVDSSVYRFISLRHGNTGWNSMLGSLRSAMAKKTRRRSTLASSSRNFPPIEYLLPDTASDMSPTAFVDDTTTGSAETKKTPLHLFSLPQELADMIFSLAYPAQDDTKFITSRRRESEYKDQSRRGTVPPELGPFKPKVCELMVSKRFFEEASKAWVRNQHIRDWRFHNQGGDAFNLEELTGYFQLAFPPNGIVKRHMIKASLHYTPRAFRPETCIDVFQCLLDLTLMVGGKTFTSVDPRLPWRARFQESDFEEIVEGNPWLANLRGLKRFKLVAQDIVEEEAQKEQWEQNVAAFESYLLPLVTRPRLQASQGPGTKTLEQQRAPPRPTPESWLQMIYNTPPGVMTTKFGLLLSPSALKPHVIAEVQEFLGKHSAAVLKEIQEMEVNKLVEEMGRLSIEGEAATVETISRLKKGKERKSETVEKKERMMGSKEHDSRKPWWVLVLAELDA